MFEWSIYPRSWKQWSVGLILQPFNNPILMCEHILQSVYAQMLFHAHLATAHTVIGCLARQSLVWPYDFMPPGK